MQVASRLTRGCEVTLIATAATKSGNQRDLTKESVSLFSGSSFASKEEPRCGARSPTLFLAAVLRGKQSDEQLGWNDTHREGSAGGTLSQASPTAPSEEGALAGLGSLPGGDCGRHPQSASPTAPSEEGALRWRDFA